MSPQFPASALGEPYPVRRWLGFATRLEAHAFLNEHGVPLNSPLEDLERDRQTSQRLGR